MNRALVILLSISIGMMTIFPGITSSSIFSPKKVGSDTPPDPPQIEGPTNCKIWVKYDYNITITDPDDDRLTELYVKFGDGTNLTLKPPGSGCCKGWRSGLTLVVSHKWKRTGNYSVEAKVRDIRWNWSDWGMLDVYVPKYKCKVGNPAYSEVSMVEYKLFILIKLILQNSCSMLYRN